MKTRYLRLIKKQRGFTLIELLAVILILGIIALIAIPTVTNTVNEARVNASKRSLDGHIQSVEQEVMINILSNSSSLNGIFTYEELNITNDKTKDTVICSMYYFQNNELIEAYNCNINDNYYCYTKDEGSNLCKDSKTNNGKSGDTDWNYDSSTKTLTISGTGKMQDYNMDNLPDYYKFKDDILKLVIEENVTSLGKYAFYDFQNLIEIRINAIKLANLAYLDGNVNTGDNYTLFNAGKGSSGIKLIFGPNVTYIPNMLLKPYLASDVPNVTDVVFEGNNIEIINAYGLAGLNMTTLKLPEGIKKMYGVALGNTSKLKVVILPDSLISDSGWTLAGCSSLEKVVFGTGSVILGDAMFWNSQSLKTVVIPNFNSKSGTNYNMFHYDNKDIDIYANSAFNDYLSLESEKEGKSNLIYHSTDEYVINITSSDDSITATKKYDDSFSFTTSKSVKVYEYYIDKKGIKYIIDEIKPVKSGNTYTINNLRIDTYIELS